HRCEFSSRDGSSVVTGTGLPPDAITRYRLVCTFGANTMIPSLLQLPPRRLYPSQMTCPTPPSAGTRLSFPPALKARAFPSGDQNTELAPSVPVKGRDCRLSSERIHTRATREVVATKAMRFPSGDTAAQPRPENAVSGGGGIVKVTGPA